MKSEVQLSNFEDLLTRRPDAIVVSPVDPESIVPLLKRSKAEGIPAVTVMVGTDEAPVVIEAAYDAGFDGGKKAAEWIKANRPDWQIKMGIVDFPLFKQTVDRAEGFIAGVKYTF